MPSLTKEQGAWPAWWAVKRERAAHLDGTVWQAAQALPPLVRCQEERQAQLPAVERYKPCRLCRPQQWRGVPEPAWPRGRRLLPPCLLALRHRLLLPLPLLLLLLRPGCCPARVNGCCQLFKGAKEGHRLVPLPRGGRQQAARAQHAAECRKRRHNVGDEPALAGRRRRSAA